jgi:hypothetical protein
MKWLILLFALVIAGAVAKDGCHVRELYVIGYTIHDPTERFFKMMAWLKVNEPFCKQSDYSIMWNNISEWAGSSDSVLLRDAIIRGYANAEAKK